MGVPLRGYAHLPTFILASVVLDLEPLLVLLLGLNYPLHGYLHTFAAAIGVGAALGLAMYPLEGIMRPIYRALQLEPEVVPRRSRFVTAGALGAVIHVLFDSLIYWDVKPFFPLSANPFYGWSSSSEVYLICAGMGALGALFWLIGVGASRLRWEGKGERD